MTSSTTHTDPFAEGDTSSDESYLVAGHFPPEGGFSDMENALGEPDSAPPPADRVDESESKSKSKPKPKSKPTANSNSNSSRSKKANPKVKPSAKPKSQAKPKSKPKPRAKPRAKPKAQAKPRNKTKPNASNANGDLETTPETNAPADGEAQSKAETNKEGKAEHGGGGGPCPTTPLTASDPGTKKRKRRPKEGGAPKGGRATKKGKVSSPPSAVPTCCYCDTQILKDVANGGNLYVELLDQCEAKLATQQQILKGLKRDIKRRESETREQVHTLEEGIKTQRILLQSVREKSTLHRQQLQDLLLNSVVDVPTY